jgi:putative ABC transport system permease protein
MGQVIVIGKGLGPQFDEQPRQIVGIVGNVREAGLNRGEVSVMYIPQSQVPEGITALASSVIPLRARFQRRAADLRSHGSRMA